MNGWGEVAATAERRGISVTLSALDGIGRGEYGSERGALEDLFRAESSGIEYGLCGGIALGLHGCPRATRDIDVLVRREDLKEIETALPQIGYDVKAEIIPFDVGKETEREVFRISKLKGAEVLTVDFLVLCHVWEDIWEEGEGETPRS